MEKVKLKIYQGVTLGALSVTKEKAGKNQQQRLQKNRG